MRCQEKMVDPSCQQCRDLSLRTVSSRTWKELGTGRLEVHWGACWLSLQGLGFVLPLPKPPWLCPGQAELTGYSSHLAQDRPWNLLLLLRNKTQASCEGYPITPVLGTTLPGILSSAPGEAFQLACWSQGGKGEDSGAPNFSSGWWKNEG